MGHPLFHVANQRSPSFWLQGCKGVEFPEWVAVVGACSDWEVGGGAEGAARMSQRV